MARRRARRSDMVDDPDDLVIRPATRAHLPALGRLGAELVAVHHAFDPRRFMSPGDVESGYARFLGQQLGHADAIVLVAEHAGAVVGYLYGAIEPASWENLREGCGYVHDVIVDAEARHRGAATALMRAAADWFRARGMPRVVLQTASANTAAPELFSRLGFRRTMVEMTLELD